MSNLQLVRVSFHDDTLEAVLAPDGRVLVPLRRPCSALGLDFASQLTRLRDPDRSPWATVVKMTVVAEDQKEREVTCVDLDTLAMWLAPITTGKVSENLRPKVVRYQKECARVLRDHFFGPKSSGDELLDSIQAIQRTAVALVEVRQRQLATDREVTTVRGIAESAQATAVAALQTAGNIHGYMTVLGYCNVTRREISEPVGAQYGRELSALCRERGLEIRRAGSERWGSVHSYPITLLREYFEDEDEPFEP